jgi:hypothetical protein
MPQFAGSAARNQWRRAGPATAAGLAQPSGLLFVDVEVAADVVERAAGRPEAGVDLVQLRGVEGRAAALQALASLDAAVQAAAAAAGLVESTT